MSASENILLPPEVVDLVVGNFSSNEDLATLHHCSLVSRNFAFAARSRIFSTLVINAYKTAQGRIRLRTIPRSLEAITRRMKALVDLLADQASDLALMVRVLQIRIDSECLIVKEGSHLDEVLKTINARASNLSTLSLGSECQSGAGLRKRSWSDLPLETASILLNICRTLPVSQLRFLFLSAIPSSIVTSPQCSCLHYIELQDSHFAVSVKDSGLYLEEGADLVSILAGNLTSQGEFLVSNHKLTAMRICVVLHSIPELKGHLARLISLLEQGLLKSLVSFTCHFIEHIHCKDFLAGVDLGRMSQLRKASFRRIYYAGPTSENLLKNISGLMDFLKRGHLQARELEEIQLIFRTESQPIHLSDDYSGIDLPLNLLRDKYPRLRELTLCLELCIGRISADAEGLRQRHEERLMTAVRSINLTLFPMTPVLRAEVKTVLYVDVDDYDCPSSRKAIERFWQC